jgi:hypothetical protein
MAMTITETMDDPTNPEMMAPFEERATRKPRCLRTLQREEGQNRSTRGTPRADPLVVLISCLHGSSGADRVLSASADSGNTSSDHHHPQHPCGGGSVRGGGEGDSKDEKEGAEDYSETSTEKVRADSEEDHSARRRERRGGMRKEGKSLVTVSSGRHTRRDDGTNPTISPMRIEFDRRVFMVAVTAAGYSLARLGKEGGKRTKVSFVDFEASRV